MLLHNLLNDKQSKTDALTVQLRRSVQLTKLFKEVGKVLLVYPCSSVTNLYIKLRSLSIVACLDGDITSTCEFDGIFHKINQNLKQASPVTSQQRHFIASYDFDFDIFG